MPLAEALKLRCTLDECRGITLPAGYDFTSEDSDGVVPIGTVKAFGGCVAICVDEVDLDASHLALKESYWLTFIPAILVTKVAHATDRPWVAGEQIYYDAAQAKFTDLTTNLTAIGFALEAAASTATEGLLRFNGECAPCTPDVTAAS